MRPTSPLSLLLFLQLTSAAPIVLPSHCSIYKECPRTRSSTPATHLRIPHFPPHQLRAGDAGDQPLLEEPINNAPVTPPPNIPHSTALSANTPLSSSYLLSLTHPSISALQSPPQKPQYLTPPTPSEPEDLDEDEGEPLPAAPTSALPLLRQLDSIRYWASLRSDPERQLLTNFKVNEQDEEIVADKEAREEDRGSDPAASPITRGCGYLLSASNTFSQPMLMAREYSDLLVVGIVVLFLGFVIIVELVQKVFDLRQAIWPRTHRRGAIYLPDDDPVAAKFEKPFFLQPPPLPRCKTVAQVYRDEDVGEVLYDDHATSE